MNKELISKKFARSVETYSEEAFAQQKIAQKMAILLHRHVQFPPEGKVLELGCGTGFFSKLLVNLYGKKSLTINDICPDMLNSCRRQIGTDIHILQGDAEKMPLPDATSLITSCSTIQWFENTGSFFRNCSSALLQNGYLAFSTFGPENVKEVSSLTGRGLSYLSLSELTKILEPFYEICHAEEELLTYSFSSPMEVLRHLKRTGVTGLGNRPMTRSELDNFTREYERRYGKDNRVNLTYHPIYIIAKKKN